MKKLMIFKTAAVFNPWLISAMLILLSIIFMFTPAAQAAGDVYYVDATGGDDVGNDGISTTTAWKTLNKVNSWDFYPGDRILFRKGETWTGNLMINDSGENGNPITFSSYGTGEKPVIRNPGTWTRSITIRDADYIVIDGFLLKDSHQTGVYIKDDSDHNIVRNCECVSMGSCVEVVTNSEYNLLTHNEVHDMTMRVNDIEPDNNDGGANGFLIRSPNNEISYNSCVNCIAESYDYGFDGGIIELYGDTSNTYVHHNWSKNSDGFLEVGGNPGVANNVRISHNVSVNNRGLFSVIHLTGVFGTTISNFRMDNNTLIDTADHGKTSYALMRFGTISPGKNFIFRNNIVMLGDFSYFSLYSFDRRNNLYHFLDPATQFIRSGQSPEISEIMDDPMFVNFQGDDFHLQPMSPARDTGIDVGLTIDYDGLSIPQGYAPDIGAYEYTDEGYENLILNPGFESGTNNWAFYSGGAANFTVTSPGAAGSANSAKVSLSSAGSNIQLNQKDITIESNTSYTLTFDAYSNTGHDLKVSLFKNVAPYTNYGLSKTVNLTSSWQNFSFKFTSPALGGTVNDARLMLWFAAHGAAGDIYRIDNVVLKAADEAPPPPPPPPADNLILNPGFESGTNNWAFYSGGAANFTVTSPGAAGSANSAKVSLSSAGSNIQLNQKDITIAPKKSYTLTFDAYSNTGHDLKVSLFKNVAPYTNYGLSKTVNLTSSWQNFSFKFTSPALGGTVNDARLMLWFAAHGAAGDIYRIDNVVLKAADEAPPPPPPPPADNLILNPGFESGTNNWAFYSGGAANFTVTSPGAAGSANSAKVSLSSAGSNIQLNQKDITIAPKKSYTLTFDAYSNTGHDLKVSLFKNVAPYTNYGLSKTVNLTTSWQNFSFEFTSPALGGTVNDSRLMFWFVDQGVAGDIYRIDNVILTPLN